MEKAVAVAETEIDGGRGGGGSDGEIAARYDRKCAVCSDVPGVT